MVHTQDSSRAGPTVQVIGHATHYTMHAATADLGATVAEIVRVHLLVCRFGAPEDLARALLVLSRYNLARACMSALVWPGAAAEWESRERLFCVSSYVASRPWLGTCGPECTTGRECPTGDDAIGAHMAAANDALRWCMEG